MVRGKNRKRVDGVSMGITAVRKLNQTQAVQLESSDFWKLVDSLNQWSEGINKGIAGCKSKANEENSETKESGQTVREYKVKVEDNVLSDSCNHGEQDIKELPREMSSNCLQDILSKSESNVIALAGSSSTVANIDLFQMTAIMNQMTAQMEEELEKLRNINRKIGRCFKSQ